VILVASPKLLQPKQKHCYAVTTAFYNIKLKIRSEFQENSIFSYTEKLVSIEFSNLPRDYSLLSEFTPKALILMDAEIGKCKLVSNVSAKIIHFIFT
jgi:hypothetical protein